MQHLGYHNLPFQGFFRYPYIDESQSEGENLGELYDRDVLIPGPHSHYNMNICWTPNPTVINDEKQSRYFFS